MNSNSFLIIFIALANTFAFYYIKNKQGLKKLLEEIIFTFFIIFFLNIVFLYSKVDRNLALAFLPFLQVPILVAFIFSIIYLPQEYKQNGTSSLLITTILAFIASTALSVYSTIISY